MPQPDERRQRARERKLLVGDGGQRRELVDEGVKDVERPERGELGGLEGGEGGDRGGGGEVEGECVQVGGRGEERGGEGGRESAGGEVEEAEIGQVGVGEVDLNPAQGECPKSFRKNT